MPCLVAYGVTSVPFRRISLVLQVASRGRSIMSVAAATKKSQGALVEEALAQYGETTSWNLIDIGINLADPSFDEVGLHG